MELEGSEQLERELTPDPHCRPPCHRLHRLACCTVRWGHVLCQHGEPIIHHNFWACGGAIQVTLDSATCLPSDQPKNDNVLPSEKPSPAPAPPEPKAKAAVDETAVPVAGAKTQSWKNKSK